MSNQKKNKSQPKTPIEPVPDPVEETTTAPRSTVRKAAIVGGIVGLGLGVAGLFGLAAASREAEVEDEDPDFSDPDFIVED